MHDYIIGPVCLLLAYGQLSGETRVKVKEYERTRKQNDGCLSACNCYRIDNFKKEGLGQGQASQTIYLSKMSTKLQISKKRN